MKNRLILFCLLCLPVWTFAFKVTIKSDSVSKGTQLFAIEDDYFFAGDTLLSYKGLAFIAEEGSVNHLPKEGKYKKVLFVRSGFKPLEIEEINVGKRTVDGVLYYTCPKMERLPQKQEAQTCIAIGDVKVDFDNNNMQVVKDATSYRYDRSLQKEETDFNISSLIKVIAAYNLIQAGHPKNSDLLFEAYEDICYLNMEMDMSETRGYYSYYTRLNVNFRFSLKDIYGNELFYDRGHYSCSNFQDFTIELNERIQDFLEEEEVLGIQDTLNNAAVDSSWKELVIPVPVVSDKNVEPKRAIVSVFNDQGHGSGCVISPEGYLLTNYHVVALMDSIQILTGTGDTLGAHFIRGNRQLDLALLKCDAPFEDFFSLSASKPTIGQTIATYGSPVDLFFDQTYSKGTFSAVRDFNQQTLYQVSAVVNPGNSGGALLDMDDRLLGIVNAKISGYGTKNIGFAIPAEHIASGLKLKWDEVQ